MKKLIIGNWKTNQNQKSIKDFFNHFNRILEKEKKPSCRFGIAPVFVHLPLVQSLAPKQMIIAAQDANAASEGAFTGTVSWSQLKDMKVKYAIIGHSERRTYYGETDDVVGQKVKALLENKMVPILCIGENLIEFEAGKSNQVCERELRNALKGIAKDLIVNLVIAYEPIWAIGTGKTASPETAQKMIHKIRSVLTNIAGQEISKKVPILYGGSVKPSNISLMMEQPDIDGALVGGASLKAEDYFRLLISC